MKSTLVGALLLANLCLLQACGGGSNSVENTDNYDTAATDSSDTDTTQSNSPDDNTSPETDNNQLATGCNAVLPSDLTSASGYRQVSLCGWQVFISDDLYSNALSADVFSALAEDIEKVEEVLPSPAYEYLKNTNIWLELDNDRFPGGVYHPSAVWLANNGYPEEWADGIQFGNAQNYLNWTAQQPAMFLHELAHALHDQFYGFNQPDIEAAYVQAMDSGIYNSVEYIDGGLQVAYATTNTTEYFAELSEAYFWINDFFPFTRDELAAFDPAGMAAVELLWQMR